MAGRRPKTAEQHRLAGNPGKRAHDPNPAEITDEPTMPSWMKGEAAREWARLAIILRGEHRFSLSWAPALEKLCTAHARWMRLMRAAANPRQPIAIGGVANPVFQMARAAEHHCRALYNDFGLTPGTRGRVKVAAPPPSEKDKLRARFFGASAAAGEGSAPRPH